MPDLGVVEIKAFVPARDFELSKLFYRDLGFEMKSSSDDIAYFVLGHCSFLLQNFYTQEHADNFMMHLLVENVDDWWSRIQESKVIDKYGVKMGEPEDREWGMRDFPLTDPSGVLWRIAHNI